MGGGGGGGYRKLQNRLGNTLIPLSTVHSLNYRSVCYIINTMAIYVLNKTCSTVTVPTLKRSATNPIKKQAEIP